MGLLRGPADRQRPPRRPPRALAGVQGHLPPLQDDARPPRGAQGRLGLPRPAGRDRGRAGARDSTARRRSRTYRDRRVQRAVPRVGVRVPGGVEPADRADRLLDRPRRRVPHAGRVLHRVGVVGARGDPPTGACCTRATRSCPYCPRCGTALSSHEVALGYRDVVDPSVYVRLPVLRSERRPTTGGRRAADLDDDAVDAAGQHGSRGRRRMSSTCAHEHGDGTR